MIEVLRPTSANDNRRIHKLIDTIYREYGFALDLAGVDVHLVDPGAHCRSHGGEFWVVEDGGDIIATVGVLLHEHAAELKSLYVIEERRRGGLGRALTDHVIEYGRRAGKQRTILWSDSRFVEAHLFYQRLEFERTSQRVLADQSVEFGFERETPQRD